MNRFESALERISKVIPEDYWTEDDLEYIQAIKDALKIVIEKEN